MRKLENQVMLRAINDAWMDHLQMIDYIREGIGLRGYGQMDPLVAYKKETFDLFEHTKRKIIEDSARLVFRAQVRVEAPQPAPDAPTPGMMRADGADAGEATESAAVATLAAPVNLDEIDWTRVGRNDLCPCGSGKKFKACHYADLRAKGVI
jgi:preprotein translocase subunit SecA